MLAIAEPPSPTRRSVGHLDVYSDGSSSSSNNIVNYLWLGAQMRAVAVCARTSDLAPRCMNSADMSDCIGGRTGDYADWETKYRSRHLSSTVPPSDEGKLSFQLVLTTTRYSGYLRLRDSCQNEIWGSTTREDIFVSDILGTTREDTMRYFSVTFSTDICGPRSFLWRRSVQERVWRSVEGVVLGQICGEIVWGRSFVEVVCGGRLGRSFGEVVWGDRLVRSFGEVVWWDRLGRLFGGFGEIVWGSFGEIVWGDRLVRSFGEIVWGDRLVRSFGEIV